MPWLLLLALTVLQDPAPVFSVVIEGGTLYDGRGGEPFVADVGIQGDRISAIGDLRNARAGRRLDASGLAVVPGFLDIHSHAVGGIFRHPLAENYIRQGVTLAVGGPDGSSPLPVAEFLARLDAEPSAINFALTVGHGTVRQRVMGSEDRDPSPDEIERMKALVDEAMREGAFGLSSGLKYVPGAFAKTEEVIALAEVAARYGGYYVSHMREEGLQLLESVDETIRIGEEAGLPTQLTHHKVVGAPMWGASARSLAMVDEARARGVDVTIDQYPYTASSTSLSILFPAWSLEGSRTDQLERLRDPGERARIKRAIVDNLEKDRGGGDPKNVVVARCEWDPTLNGKSLADILREQGRPVTLEEAAELALELQQKGGFGGIFHAMAEEDVQRILAHPYTMVASDGGIVAPGEGVPHPRNYGTFARVLGHYARDLGIVSFQEAVRKMTSLPAARMALSDRGVLREGAMADVVVLDIDAIDDPAEFGDPHHYATGVRHVFVNGAAALLDGEMTGARPGRALRRSASSEPDSLPAFDADTLVDLWVALWSSYDLDEVDQLFLSDARVTYFSSEKEGLVEGIDAVREHHHGFGFVGGGRDPDQELWVEEVRADDFGDSAVVTAIWYFGDRGLTSEAQHGPMTMVYVREGGEFRIAHLHFANY